MAVQALPSKFSIKWNMMCGAMMIFLAGYFYYDGHYNQTYIDKHMILNEETGQKEPDVDLIINRFWGPIGCVATGLYFGYITLVMSRKKITVDEKGITFSDGKVIPLENLTKIDKSKLKTKGRLLVEYEEAGKPSQIILKDTVYDGINELLQEILRLTGKDKDSNPTE